MNSVTSYGSYGSYGSSLQAYAAAASQWNGKSSRSASWFESMSDAWGRTLDQQAARIEDLSGSIAGGNDKPEVVTLLSAESLRMGFLSTSSHTAISTAGEALKTMAQKS